MFFFFFFLEGGGVSGGAVQLWTLRGLGGCITNYCFNIMGQTIKMQTADIRHCIRPSRGNN